MINLHMKPFVEQNDFSDFYNFILNNTDYFTDYAKTEPTYKEVKEEFLLDIPPNVPLNNKKVFGVYENEKLIGFLDLLFKYPEPTTCMIGYLVIDQNYRKQGIAQQVYVQAKSYIAESGMEKIRLGVIADNIPAVKLWEKQGYVIIDMMETEYGKQLTMEYEF